MRGARNPIFAAVLALTLWAIGALQAVALGDTYYLTGQVHPAFHISAMINGETVKTVRPKPTKPKIFITALADDALRPGINELVVEYEVMGAEEFELPLPSFRLDVRRKWGASSDQEEKLIVIRGPGRPFPAAGTTGRVSSSFTVVK